LAWPSGLRTLSELVWDVEAELARAKEARAALMRSSQADLRRDGR